MGNVVENRREDEMWMKNDSSAMRLPLPGKES